MAKIWRALANVDGLWCAERNGPGGVPLRSTAIRLADERLAIYSPVRGLGAEAHRQLSSLGHPTFVVAPNHFHNAGITEYARAYPGLTIVGSATAVPRLQRQCKQEVVDQRRLREALPDGISLRVPPNTSNGELWISIQAPAARTWLVGDGFFNIARTPRSPLGLLLRLLGISPGLRIGTSYRWFLRDRKAYRQWLLDILDADKPVLLIPCHGDIVSDANLPDRLGDLARRRL